MVDVTHDGHYRGTLPQIFGVIIDFQIFKMRLIDDFFLFEVVAKFQAYRSDHFIVENLVDRHSLPLKEKEFDDRGSRDVDGFA